MFVPFDVFLNGNTRVSTGALRDRTTRSSPFYLTYKNAFPKLTTPMAQALVIRPR